VAHPMGFDQLSRISRCLIMMPGSGRSGENIAGQLASPRKALHGLITLAWNLSDVAICLKYLHRDRSDVNRCSQLGRLGSSHQTRPRDTRRDRQVSPGAGRRISSRSVSYFTRICSNRLHDRAIVPF
jgi:hypothetical protein